MVRRDSSRAIQEWQYEVYGAGRKIGQDTRFPGVPSQKGYVVTDYQGNMRNVFSYDYGSNPTLVEAVWYDPLGKQDSLWIAGNETGRFTYNDKEMDSEIGGLYYYGARFYNPRFGRFTLYRTQSEPAGGIFISWLHLIWEHVTDAQPSTKNPPVGSLWVGYK